MKLVDAECSVVFILFQVTEPIGHVLTRTEVCTVHYEALPQRILGYQWTVYDVPVEMEASHRSPSAGVDHCHLPGDITA